MADRAGFENRCAREGTAGSNPALSVYGKKWGEMKVYDIKVRGS